jgi:hypothetical protein
MIYAIGEVVGIGFTAGIVTGTMVFLANWILSAAMNILKFPTKGD